MENMASAYVWISIAFFLAFLVLTYVSCWLYGLRWFVLTVATLACTFTALAAEVVATTSGIKLWLTIAILTWVFGAIFYLITIRYLTHTKLLDITYQSHEALRKFIDERGIASPLATVIRVLGPILLAGIVILGGLGVLAKNNGVLL